MVEALVRSALVQRAAFGAVRAKFQIVKRFPEFILNLFPAAVQRNVKAQLPHVGGKRENRLRVLAFTEKKKAVYAEVIGHKAVYYIGGKFLAHILFKEGRVASYAVSPAIGNIDCQGNTVRNLFHDHGCHFRDVLYHLSM